MKRINRFRGAVDERKCVDGGRQSFDPVVVLLLAMCISLLECKSELF